METLINRLKFAKKDFAFSANVQFELKHSYFQRLHNAIDMLSPEIIVKVMPEKTDFREGNHIVAARPEYERLELDRTGQMQALNAITSSCSTAPVLVVGPFGTGKTRVLARAAYQILRSRDSGIRVLICAHHQASVDTFMEYFGEMKQDPNEPWRVKLVRITPNRSYHSKTRDNFEVFYKTAREIKDKMNSFRLFVTTLGTALHLFPKLANSFTHILMDEGAQTREPESVGPLCLANSYTKIIIAGDHYQVGPRLLVLGDEAQENGLGLSLLERLHKRYETLGRVAQQHTVALLTNYRCHSGILLLPSSLFYGSTLQCRVPEDTAHPDAPYPLVFVCSSLDTSVQSVNKDTDESEARVLLQQVSRFVTNWPRNWGRQDLSKICIMTPSTNQKALIVHQARSRKDLKGIEVLKAYEIQGREFRAIFIGTSEITTDKGETLNPTKSICDRYVFNTAITRAQSLVVSVGNPLMLLKMERHMEVKYRERGRCWTEYIRRCLECKTFFPPPLGNELSISEFQHAKELLYKEIFGRIDRPEPDVDYHRDNQHGDSILSAYQKQFESIPDCKKTKLILRNIGRNLIWNLKESEGDAQEIEGDQQAEENQLEQGNYSETYKCQLSIKHYRRAEAIPLDHTKTIVKIGGTGNRRGAFDGDIVKVGIFRNNPVGKCYGKVIEVLEATHDRKFVCTVYHKNSTMFCPIDKKNPLILNLPRLSRDLLMRPWQNRTTINDNLKSTDVVIFDPNSVTQCKSGHLPQIQSVIPLSIAQKMLFIVHFLQWKPKYRLPLGIVTGALPKGLSFFEGERLLKMEHDVKYNEQDDYVVSAPSDHQREPSLPLYERAFTIDPENARNLDDAVSLVQLESKDKTVRYQLAVHIVNAARHITDGSIQNRKARDLGTSVYAGAEGKTMHMLPVHVRKQLSLDPKCIRDVISIVTNVSLDSDLHNITLHEVTIQQAQMKSSMRLSYKSAQVIMEGQCLLEGGLDTVIKGFDASPGQPTLTKTLQLLYRIALHMRQERFKSLAAYCYEVEEPDERSCWQTHMMIEELMIWANSVVASHTYNRFQDMALVRRQGAPNIEEQAAVVGEHSLVMGNSLSFQQMLSQALTSVPFLVPLCTMREIIRALDSGCLTLLVNLIASNHYYPQLAASAAQLRSLQQPAKYCCTSSDKDRSFYKHHSLNLDLYTHFTSPMRRYLDIQVQRMVTAILKPSNGQEDFKEDSHQKLCQLLNAKATNAKRFGRKMKSLTLAHGYTSSSELFDAFITSVSKGSIELCFPNLEMKCVNKQERTFSIKYLGSLGRVVSDQEDNETHHTWKIKMTSFQHPAFIFDTPGISQVQKKRTQEKSRGAESSSDGSSISLKFEVALPDDGSNNRLRMVEYSATTTPPFVKVDAKEWQKALEFVKNPTTEGMQALKGIFHLPSESLAACSHDPEQNSCSFVVYHLSRSLAAYNSIKVWMTYSTREAILSPTLQLVELAPHMRICLQHNTHPAECFSDPILNNASRKVYNNIQEYVQLWEKVLLAEGSEKSAREGQPVIIQDVTLKWPKLVIPPNCMDEIYYEPQGNVSMELPETFQEESSEFFRIRVGDMICARYGTKTEPRSEVRAVFHMVVAVGPPTGKKSDDAVPSVEMKFIGKENCRVSEKMKEMLESGGATCEVQLVAMSTSYQRVYKSLVKLAPKPRGRGDSGKRDDGVSQLAREIAVGETRGEMRRPYFLSAVEYRKEAHHIFQWDFLARTLWHSGKLQLNRVQTEAVELALNKRFQLIQGPPGTGKSETGAHISYVFAMLNRTLEGGKCVLYCGPSNKAVDVVLNNLHILIQKHPQCNLKILRIYGRAVEKQLYPGPYRHKYVYQREQSDYGCPEWAKGYTLHHQIRQVEMHPAFKKVVELERKFQHDVSQGYIATSASCKEYRTAITEAEEIVLTKHFDIVLCTCNEASSNRVCGKIGPYGVVKKYVSPRQCIIDESGMASEPESMAPISLCEHVVLLGDHKQLQPIVDYHPAREHGLATSLFQRYAQRDEGFCTTLRIQYRMHEAICAFPSKHFYSGVLITDESVKKRTNPETRLKGFWPQGPQRPILFCDTVGKEGEYRTGSKGEKHIGIDSKFNLDEAQKVVQLARVLHHVHGVKLNELAILTPYSAQKEAIKKLAAEAKLLNKSPSDTIKVASITESQGDEYGIVLLSTVRSQPIAEIAHPDRVQADRGWLLENLGFLTDEHQINVGITRSKYGLVIVGNKRLLQYDSTWENLLDHYEEKHCIVNAQSFPRNSDLRKLPQI